MGFVSLLIAIVCFVMLIRQEFVMEKLLNVSKKEVNIYRPYFIAMSTMGIVLGSWFFFSSIWE